MNAKTTEQKTAVFTPCAESAEATRAFPVLDVSAIAFCRSRLLLSAIVTTPFRRASFITCCHWLTTAVASPCAPGNVAGTGAAGR